MHADDPEVDVRSTFHRPLTGVPTTGDARRGDDAEPDDDDACIPAVAAMPSRLPLAALDILLADGRRLGATHPEGFGPLGPIVGIGARDGGGGTVEDADHDPLGRLRAGAWLAIPVHAGPLDGPVRLIDGLTYAPEAADFDSTADAQADRPRGSADSFRHAIAVGLEEGTLRLRPVAVSRDARGEACVTAGRFPERLRRRIAAYLARLA